MIQHLNSLAMLVRFNLYQYNTGYKYYNNCYIGVESLCIQANKKSRKHLLRFFIGLILKNSPGLFYIVF